MEDLIVDYLSGIELGGIQEFGKMTVFPVFTDADGSIEYFTLKEAVNKDLLIISEIDESGNVPELKVTNLAKIPVLLLDGEELVGAKQNRIVNTTILLKENSKTIIPVSCTEQGRWAYNSKNFGDSGVVASYQVRNKKSASVKRSVQSSGNFYSDQGAVWDEINKMQRNMEVQSPTCALKDVYEAKDSDLDNYLNTFELMDGQKGLLVFIDGEIVGFDIVSLESAYKDLHKKLVKSYALDAMIQKNENKSGSIRIDQIKGFINEIVRGSQSKHKSIGYGCDYRFDSNFYIGSALVHMDNIIHISFFRIINTERSDVGDMVRYGQRVSFRM